MTTFITIIYIIVALIMILSILLQAGKGGGLGSALGGGASQGVFGGGGGADFMSKLTQGFAATFMICAMYLAYASAHAGSEFLSEQDDGSADLLEADEEIDYERLGPRAQPLPTPEEGKAMQAKAAALVPAQTEAPSEMIDGAAADGAAADAVAPAP
ncbi:preprotein translocase subunit SecG, partial [Enhygromyxa salina]|uniref:preprotein translocase subunit SecG n=1 Tax=Enhygromyxa salina TaxID=215803 RepID=UPI000696800B